MSDLSALLPDVVAPAPYDTGLGGGFGAKRIEKVIVRWGKADV